MANVLRWRYGATNPVMMPVDSAQVIEIGDLVWQNTDDVRPASASTYAGGLATSQEALVDNFLGVAAQASASGDTAEIRVDTTGTFQFICASSTAEVGDLMGAADNTTALADQTVIEVEDVARAIGRCDKRNAAAATSVYVRIESTVMTGGAQNEEASA